MRIAPPFLVERWPDALGAHGSGAGPRSGVAWTHRDSGHGELLRRLTPGRSTRRAQLGEIMATFFGSVLALHGDPRTGVGDGIGR